MNKQSVWCRFWKQNGDWVKSFTRVREFLWKYLQRRSAHRQNSKHKVRWYHLKQVSEIFVENSVRLRKYYLEIFWIRGQGGNLLAAIFSEFWRAKSDINQKFVQSPQPAAILPEPESDRLGNFFSPWTWWTPKNELLLFSRLGNFCINFWVLHELLLFQGLAIFTWTPENELLLFFKAWQFLYEPLGPVNEVLNLVYVHILSAYIIWVSYGVYDLETRWTFL